MKDLEYFLSLPYRIEIRPIPETEGGGYGACIPRLGRYAVCADGETIREAMENLQAIKEERLTEYLSEGLNIPEPERDDEDYSGRFVLRIPKSLHKELALRAKENSVSLNQLAASLLARGLQGDVYRAELENLRWEIDRLIHEFQPIQYALNQGDQDRHSVSNVVGDEGPKAVL
jgi:predicted HicB family RNase H-like nuclease